MELITGTNLSVYNLGVTPFDRKRDSLLRPEIRKANREDVRHKKLSDFREALDAELPVEKGSIDQDTKRAIDKLMTRIAGRDLESRNIMIREVNRLLKARNDSVRFAMLPLQENSLTISSFAEFQKAFDIIRDLRSEWNSEALQSNGSTIDVAEETPEILTERIIKQLRTLAIEMQIQCGLQSGTIAMRSMRQAILGLDRIRHEIVIHLYEDAHADPELDRPTHRVIVPRDLMPVLANTKDALVALGRMNCEELGDQSSLLKATLDDILQSKEFVRELRKIFRHVGLDVKGAAHEVLGRFGKELRAIARACVQPFVFDLYGNECISTPLMPLDEKSFISNLRIIRASKPLKRKSKEEVPECILNGPNGSGVSIRVFNKIVNDLITKAVQNKKTSSPQGFQNQLKIEIKQYLTSSSHELAFSGVQTAIFQFVWYMGAYGTPDSKRDARVGGDTTVLRYFDAVSSALQIEFGNEDFFQLSSAEIIESIDAILSSTQKRTWYARRFAFFLRALEDIGQIEEVSDALISQFGSDSLVQARAQVVSHADFLGSIKATDHLPNRSERYAKVLLLSLGYRAGLRFVETWNLQLQDIQISKRGVAITVRAKGHWRPKTRAGNRWVMMLGDLTWRELRAICWVRRVLRKQGRKSYVFHRLSGGSTLGVRNKFHREMNSLLKSVTASQRACYHDLRHTFVSNYVLAFYADHARTRQLRYLTQNATMRIELPESLRYRGERAPYWAVAIAEKTGHGAFNPTTSANYFHWAAEIYAECWSRSNIPNLSLQTMTHLTGGQVTNQGVLDDLRDSAYQTQITEVQFKQAYGKGGLSVEADSASMKSTPSTIGRLLIGETPEGKSEFDMISPEGVSWAKDVLTQAILMTNWNLVWFKPQETLDAIADAKFIAPLKLHFVAGYREHLDKIIPTEYQSLLADLRVLDQLSGKRVHFHFENPGRLSQFMRLTSLLGIDDRRFEIRSNCVDVFEHAVGHCVVNKVARKVSHETDYCKVRLSGRSENGRLGMQDLTSILFVNALSAKIMESG